jgi:hypothetical protein
MPRGEQRTSAPFGRFSLGADGKIQKEHHVIAGIREPEVGTRPTWIVISRESFVPESRKQHAASACPRGGAFYRGCIRTIG